MAGELMSVMPSGGGIGPAKSSGGLALPPCFAGNHPKIDGKLLAADPQIGALAFRLADALGNRLRRQIVRVDAGDEPIHGLRDEAVIEGSLRGFGGVTLPPILFSQRPAHFEPRPA